MINLNYLNQFRRVHIMYQYTFELIFKKKSSTLNFPDCLDKIEEAISNINNGLAFRRDRKTMEILNPISDNKLTIRLNSKESLQNPSRSLSSITRYLTSYHTDYFKDSIYNRTLFDIILISTNSSFPTIDYDISNEEMLKGIIDLLYSFTATTNTEAKERNQVIKEIKKLVVPYIK